MANETTKACNLTEDEVKILIHNHGYNLSDDIDARVDRINYLNKRLKAFSEPTAEAKPLEHNAAAIADEAKPTTQGWGTASNG